MFGLPLLPPQLSRLFATYLAPPIYKPNRRVPKPSLPINQYCESEWDLPHDSIGTSTDFIASLVAPIVSSTCAIAAGDLLPYSRDFITRESHAEIFRESALVEVPLSFAPICAVDELASLPLLETTWGTLTTKSISLDNLASLLAGGSVLDAVQQIGCIRAILDISITSSSWIDTRGRVAMAQVPANLTDAFEIARQRCARQSSPLRIGSNAELQRLAAIVGREKSFPLNAGGQTKTLDMVGKDLNLTRERVRQLESKYRLKEVVLRRWPLSDDLNLLKAAISSLQGSTADAANESLSKQFPELGPSAFEAGVALLAAFGHSPGLVKAQGRLRSSSSFTQLPFTKSAVQRVSRDLAGPLGFVRSDDVLETLVEMYPEADRKLTLELIQDSAAVSDLPDDYLFVRDPRRSQFTGTMHRMLGCTNPLSVSELREGLQRRVSFRRLSAAPSIDVLLAILERLPDFIVNGEMIESLTPELPDSGSLVEWMLKKIDSTGFDCIHKSQLLDDARLEGKKTSSVSVYCSLSEQFVTLPKGCVGRIGQVPRLSLIELASQQARMLRVASRFTTRDFGDQVVVTVSVGTGFANSGLFTGSSSLRRQIELQPLPVFADGTRHGTISVSGNTLYGFISAINAIEASVGDQIEIRFDFTQERVDVNFSQPESDDD
jgi:hypothetical protein